MTASSTTASLTTSILASWPPISLRTTYQWNGARVAVDTWQDFSSNYLSVKLSNVYTGLYDTRVYSDVITDYVCIWKVSTWKRLLLRLKAFFLFSLLLIKCSNTFLTECYRVLRLLSVKLCFTYKQLLSCLLIKWIVLCFNRIFWWREDFIKVKENILLNIKKLFFLFSRNWGFCLLDTPSPDHDRFNYPKTLPGVIYSADHQCQLMFGFDSKHCKKIEVRFKKFFLNIKWSNINVLLFYSSFIILNHFLYLHIIWLHGFN